MTRTCRGYTSDGSAGQAYSQGPHQLEDDATNFSPGKSQCRDCYRAYAADWRAKRGASGAVSTTRRRQGGAAKQTIVIPDLRIMRKEAEDDDEDGESVSDDDLAQGSHAYVPGARLLEVWGAMTNGVSKGKPAGNLMFLGPKGCGKTEGAHFLASTIGLPFVKIDAASMTDPESWFGTREVVNEGGVSVTKYNPSLFALMLEQPCVMLIDEMNRAKDTDRNVLIPVLDKTRRVMNPLTGDVIHRHPRCFIIMSGNQGLSFTGTYAIDPAFISRSLTQRFDFVSQVDEIQIAKEATGCDDEVATLFVRFASDTRAKARLDPDFEPISTREVLEACQLVVDGASLDTAAYATVIDAASPEGGTASVQMQLESIWTGIRKQPVASDLRPCGLSHPWQTRTMPDGNEVDVTCEVQVPISTLVGSHGHPANPQHHGTGDGGQTIVWNSQP